MPRLMSVALTEDAVRFLAQRCWDDWRRRPKRTGGRVMVRLGRLITIPEATR